MPTSLNNSKSSAAPKAVGRRSTARQAVQESPTPQALTAVPLYPYQRRWIEDDSRFKLAVKATQIGYSYAAALEAVLDCVERETMWIVLSRGERQSIEFMQKA